MHGILFDLDGVFYTGDQAIDGATQALDWVKSAGIPYLFVTNTSSRPRSALLEKLKHFNIQATEEQILTPAVACRLWLQQHIHDASIALFLPQATQQEFTGFTYTTDEQQAVAAVIVGDLGQAWDYTLLNRAFRMLMQSPKPQLIALGMSRYWRAEDGLRLDVAPFIQALSFASDSEPLVMGKPSATFFQSALQLLGTEQAIMIGDDIRSDIGGAQNAGLEGILVRTGKFKTQDLQLDIKPDAIIDSIRDLPDWWQRYKSA